MPGSISRQSLRRVAWTGVLVPSAVLSRLPTLVQCIEYDVYCEFEANARQRIRNVRDWPVLATALALDCPVWTEDQDSSEAEWPHGPPAP
jgi:hypothetical protein